MYFAKEVMSSFFYVHWKFFKIFETEIKKKKRPNAEQQTPFGN